ncbi:MAG TPA: CGNR zinc finger domain-containing protein [Thermoanaerobaculia bacterium]|nr:CGNR zinc finger domain-containing protein [Thermoanaerobaculia bacterium]
MEESAQPDASWRLVGERPCLDFVNTVGGRVSSPDEAGVTRDYADRVLRDNLPDYDALLRWSTFASLLEPSEAGRLRNEAGRSPEAAQRVLRRALRLREALYRLGKALVEDWPPPDADLRILDQEVREARQHQRLAAKERRLEAEWIADPPRLDRMLWPIALSALAVFGSDDVHRLKQCGGPRCGWLFVDTTRNRSRQWCEMANCGNLAKVQRFRARRRGGG